MYVDRDMWEKIVLNLLSNAFKFTFEGEIPVRLRKVDDHVGLSIHDSGVGFRNISRCAFLSVSIASTGRKAAPTRAAALGWPWCRSLPNFTMVRSKVDVAGSRKQFRRDYTA